MTDIHDVIGLNRQLKRLVDEYRAENKRLKQTARELRKILIEAANHLEYCGYGDSWEQSCAREAKLPSRIEDVLEHADWIIPRRRK